MSMRDTLRTMRRLLHLSPMQKVLRGLRNRGVALHELNALEMFAGTGAFHTLDYAPDVARLDAWELDTGRAEAFKRALPDAKIRITDTYLAAKTEIKRYDLILVDNPASRHGDHFEHFDLFPDLFRLCADRAVLVLNVIPRISPAALARFPSLADTAHHKARAAFYGVPHPDELTAEQLGATYRAQAAANGFRIEWEFLVRRHVVYYYVMGLVREEGRR